MKIFRLHIRPNGGLKNPDYSFGYCLHNQLLGLGWGVDILLGTKLTWDRYENLALKVYDQRKLSSARRFHDQPQVDDLIWTRDTKGRYYLGQVQSGWEYMDSEEGRNADILNVVRCRIVEVTPTDAVPGKVVACFRPRIIFQRINDQTVTLYSQLLWNELVGTAHYDVKRDSERNIFSYLDSDATEDVIFIYLQTRGLLVIPNSRKGDTMGYGYVVIHPRSGKRGIVQIKTGSASLSMERWAGLAEKVVLFQANGHYGGAKTKGVACLSPKVVEEFMRDNAKIMPTSVQHWLRYVYP